MKVLINKTHEIEVDEKFRDLFPMEGCEGLRCRECPFHEHRYSLYYCKLDDFNVQIIRGNLIAEIVEDKIDFNRLEFGQIVYFDGVERTVNRKRILIEKDRTEYCIGLDSTSTVWYIFDNKRFSLTPPSKKKVIKTVETWVLVDPKINIVEHLSNYENAYTNNFVKVKLSGSYTTEE
jgi:hypothetical protein